MEPKKSPEADLEKKKGLFLQIGLVFLKKSFRLLNRKKSHHRRRHRQHKLLMW